MPGVGVRTAARLLIDAASRAFASAGHLAAYAGLYESYFKGDGSGSRNRSHLCHCKYTQRSSWIEKEDRRDATIGSIVPQTVDLLNAAETVR